jgi:endo-1,4-beta-mannosidase
VVRAKPRNWYGDPAVLSAQLLLAREVASALGKHPALWAFDLGNENSNCVVPPSRESAVRWLDAVVGEIRAIDSSHQVTIGLHMEDLEEDRNLGPKEAARVCDFLCMHGYPIYADWAESRHDALILPFLGLITGWLGGREVLFEEFGAPAVSGAQINANSGVAKLFSEEETASFMRDALEALHRFGFLGAMWWCYGDYAKWLWSWPPLDLAEHERYFGLWRSDYSAGPAVAEAGRFRNVERGRRPDDLSWIDIEPTRFYEDPRGHLGSLYHKFRLAQLH